VRDEVAVAEEIVETVTVETVEPVETAVAGSVDDASALLPLLDLPEPHESAEPAARRSAEETEQLLGSVLASLPQPKEPGQGRSRSRRASTAVIAGGEIAPKTE
jgi:ribonuclease E